MDQEMKKRLTSADNWLRMLFMVVFAIVNYCLQFLIWVVAFIQLILSFFGKRNKELLNFGGGLSRFSYQIWLFLTYQTEEKPFPFSAWPSATPTKTKKKQKKHEKMSSEKGKSDSLQAAEAHEGAEVPFIAEPEPEPEIEPSTETDSDR